MTIDTDHLRRTARLLSSHSRNILTPAGVDAVIAACDHIDAQAAEIAALRIQNEGYGGSIAKRDLEIDRLREALTECHTLLRRTPKITRDIYVGKDRVAWGRQADGVRALVSAALSGEPNGA